MFGKKKEILDDDLTKIEEEKKMTETESRNATDSNNIPLEEDDQEDDLDDLDNEDLDDRGGKYLTFLSVVLVIAILGVIGFGVYSIYSKFEKKPEVAVVNDDGTVVVPGIVGMTQTDAEKVLKNTELGLKRNRSVISDEPEGMIIAQEPSAGESVDPYTTILYDVSSGTAEAIMPDVTNIELYQAIQVLDEMNISNVKTEKTYDEAFGTVTRTEPQAGANITS